MKLATVLSTLVTALVLAGCGADDSKSDSLTVYSGREEELVQPLIDMFEEQAGITVDVRYGESAELAATIAEEGGNSPADVFFSQDPGSLGAVDDELAELPQGTLDRVAERFRDSGGKWVGTSGRTRVLAYNTDALAEDQVPDSVFDLTDPAWKGKIGIAPTNASFQAFVTAMRLSVGEERTRQWLIDLKQNDPKTYEKNTPIVEALATGEIELGLVNHYYLYLVKEEQPEAPIANHFLAKGDPGALVSVAGAGVLASAANKEGAEQFIDYLLSDEGQRFYTDSAEEAEYPLVGGIEAKAGLPPLDTLEGPNVDLSTFGAELSSTLELLRETGYLS
jgi:iron(III) transport system substrate-binding protein